MLPKSLLIIALNILSQSGLDFSPAFLASGRCEEIQVSWRIKDTSDGLSNGSIELEFAGDRSQYAVYLLTVSGKTKLKSTEISIRNLKKGKHGIVITGAKEGSDFCQKFFEVVIN
jgi:hypothetical protein